MSEFSKPCQVLFNQRPVLYSESADFDLESGDNEVFTLDDGLAGHSDGAARAKLTLRQAIPQGGYQIDWNALIISHTTIYPTVKIGGKSYSCRGRVMSAATGSKVNDANMVNVTMSLKVLSSVSDT